MLQKVTMESRKSNTLKKWLLLITRCIIIAALVTAFAQPFAAEESAFKAKETVVYIDDSFSMQAKTNGLSLWDKSVQELIKHSREEQEFSLFTNTVTFKDINIKDIQNQLLELPNTYNQFTLEDIRLKAETLFSNNPNSEKHLIVVSDFQNTMGFLDNKSSSSFDFHLVHVSAPNTSNVSIDSIFLAKNNTSQQLLEVYLSSSGETNTQPISLYDGDKLIAKSAVTFEDALNAQVNFSIPGDKPIDGILQISDNGVLYDNRFFFNINQRPKLKVLAVSEGGDEYLRRLFTDDEFELSKYTLNQLDYGLLDGQNVVILDNLSQIPTSLQRVLVTFKQNGGTLIIVPSSESDLDSYNVLLSQFYATRFLEPVQTEKRISKIAFDHPLFEGVFESRVENFQFPNTKSYFRVQSRAPQIIAFEGNEPFLLGNDGFYVFTSSLARDVGNFKNSPLIVPTFYNMALSGLQVPKLYQTIGSTNEIDIEVGLGNDEVLNLENKETKFIPLQKSFPNKVRLSFAEEPKTDGIFDVKMNDRSLSKISFNYPRNESNLSFAQVDTIQGLTTTDSLASMFQFLDERSQVTSYWKWFVILALLLALAEVIIQKFVT